MGFAQSRRAEQEKRVVKLRRVLGDGESGRLRKLIGRADNKVVKRIVGP